MGKISKGTQHLKRSASFISEDSPSGSDDEIAMQLSDVEPDLQRGQKRRIHEREWLKHKRRALRKEEGLTRQRAVEAAEVQRREAEAAHELGRSVMSKEEQARYDSVVTA